MKVMRVGHALDVRRTRSMRKAGRRARAKPHSKRLALSMSGMWGAEGGGGHFGRGSHGGRYLCWQNGIRVGTVFLPVRLDS